MKARFTVVIVILLFALALFAQTTTAPKTDAAGCPCCKEMAADGKAMDCCKDGKCCGDAKMCARDKDGKMACCKGDAKDGKMSCCGDKCPMKSGKTTAKGSCCGDKCPMMKAHSEHKGM